MFPKRALLLTCGAAALVLTMRSPSDATGPAATWTPPGPGGAGSAMPADPLGTATRVPAPAASPAAKDGPVDVGALRYFAAQRNAARVEAELRLLRRSHPDFQPPDDLYTDAQGSGDEQPLWDLYAKRDLAGLRAMMEALRGADASWHPSSDLLGKLALAEGHAALVKASDEKRWPDAVGIAATNKGLLTCQDPDALWRTAEALVEMGDEVRGSAAYRYVLSNCEGDAVRLATVQKAGLTLRDPGSFDRILAMGRQQPDGRGEFDAARLEIIRQRVGTSGAEPSQGDIDALAAVARTASGAVDAQLLGWSFYDRAKYPEAERWFRTALGAEKHPKAAEGLVLTLRASGDMAGARAAAIDYASLDEANRKLMIEVVSAALVDQSAKPPTEAELKAFTRTVEEATSRDGAQALSIYYSNQHDKTGSALWSNRYAQWKEADIDQFKSSEEAKAYAWKLFHDGNVARSERWFRKSAEWDANESAAIGQILVAYRLHRQAEYRSLLARYRGKFEGVAALDVKVGPRQTIVSRLSPPRRDAAHDRVTRMVRSVPHRQREEHGGDWDKSASDIVLAAQSGKYDQAYAMLEQRRSRRSEPRGLSVVRGWVLYNTGRWEEAKQVFSGLDSGRFSMERQEGLRVIQQAYTPPHVR